MAYIFGAKFVGIVLCVIYMSFFDYIQFSRLY